GAATGRTRRSTTSSSPAPSNPSSATSRTTTAWAAITLPTPAATPSMPPATTFVACSMVEAVVAQDPDYVPSSNPSEIGFFTADNSSLILSSRIIWLLREGCEGWLDFTGVACAGRCYCDPY